MTPSSDATAIPAALRQALQWQQQGRWNEAERLLLDRLQRAPGEPELHRALAQLHARTGRVAQAIDGMGNAVALAPQAAVLRCELGRLLAGSGQPDAAIEAFAAATRIDPDAVEGWFFLGVTLRRQQLITAALEALRRAHRLDAEHPQALHELADLEFEHGDPVDALPLWRRLAERRPLEPAILLKLAETLSRLSDHAAALDVYRRGLQRLPESADLWLGCAQAQEDVGDRAGAQHSYERALQLRPGWPFALGGLLELKRADASPALLTEATRRQQDADLTDAERALIGYGLGKALDGLGRHAEAFASMRDANAARRRQIGPFDRAQFDEQLDWFRQRFGAGLRERHAAAGNSDPRPVFIVGMPRSGTTLVEQIIAAHPSATGCGELPDLARISTTIGREAPWLDERGDTGTALLASQGRRYLATLDQLAGTDAVRVVDKAPLNLFHVGLIAALFPRARVVWCRRDPRDVGLSIFSENFSLQSHYATDLADIGYFHKGHERLMRHWQQSVPLPIMEVVYEDLVADLEGITRTLIAFLDLPWDPACLAFHSSGRAVQTPSRWQVRQPIYTRSLGRWRNYAEWLGPLEAELARDGS